MALVWWSIKVYSFTKHLFGICCMLNTVVAEMSKTQSFLSFSLIFFKVYLVSYLAIPGLSCSMWDL